MPLRHLSRIKRRKLYYVPGLISIIGLPILLFFFFPQDTRQCVIRVNLPTDKKDDPGRFMYSTDYVYQSLKGKKITTIDLDEERNKDDERDDFFYYRKRAFILQEIEHLKFTNDTSHVLKIRLGWYNTYGDFIWVLDQAYVYRIKRFHIVNDGIYLCADPPVEHNGPEVIEIENPNYVAPTPAEISAQKWKIFFFRLREWWKLVVFVVKRNPVIVIGFILLIVIPSLGFLRGLPSRP